MVSCFMWHVRMANNIDKSQVFLNIGLSFINISTELSTVKPFLVEEKDKVKRQRRELGTSFKVLPPGLEPGTTVPKTVVISISPRERREHHTLVG